LLSVFEHGERTPGFWELKEFYSEKAIILIIDDCAYKMVIDNPDNVQSLTCIVPFQIPQLIATKLGSTDSTWEKAFKQEAAKHKTNLTLKAS
jgi:hypothetical protein